jgi:hypothetical protein
MSEIRAISCVAFVVMGGCSAGTGLEVSISARVPLTSVTMMAAIERPVRQKTHMVSVHGATTTSFTIELPDADENVALAITALTQAGQALTHTASQFVAAHTWLTLTVDLDTGAANDGGTPLDLGETDKGDLAAPPITFVQRVSAGGNDAYANSRQATITLAANDLVVAAIFWNDNSASVTVGDSAGNAWQSLAALPSHAACANKNGPRVQLWYAADTRPGTTTITAQQSGATMNPMGFFVLEYANVKHATPVDAESGAAATVASNAMSPGALTTTRGDELIVALFNDAKGNGTMRPGAGYRARAEDGSAYALVEDNLPSTLAAGRHAPAAYLPMGTSDACWGATAAAFRPR